MDNDTDRRIRREMAVVWADLYVCLYKAGLKEPTELLISYGAMLKGKRDSLIQQGAGW